MLHRCAHEDDASDTVGIITQIDLSVEKDHSKRGTNHAIGIWKNDHGSYLFLPPLTHVLCFLLTWDVCRRKKKRTFLGTLGAVFDTESFAHRNRFASAHPRESVDQQVWPFYNSLPDGLMSFYRFMIHVFYGFS